MKKFCYRVQKDETLLDISKKFNQSVFWVINENGLKDEIEEGDILVLSRSEGEIYEVLPHETIEGVCLKLGVSEERLFSLNGNIDYVFYGLKLKY